MLTQKRLKELLHYDPSTGVFNSKIVNKVLGSVSEKGYIRLNIQKRLYMAHRIAWLYVTGSFPVSEIDHIDGDRSNNRWSNLRLATRKQNMENTSLYSNNTSGYKGVIWYKRNNKWGATTFHNGRRYFAGLYDNPEDANNAVKSLRDKLFTHHRTSYSS